MNLCLQRISSLRNPLKQHPLRTRTQRIQFRLRRLRSQASRGPPPIPARLCLQNQKVGGKNYSNGLTLDRMNLRHKKPNDSLYMLLDTMCNAFGGIILLAVLVVLLTNKEKSQSQSSSDSPEMLQRRLTLAQTNLDESLQLEATLQAEASDGRWKQQIGLLSTRKQLQEAIQDTRDVITQDGKELETANAADPAERLKFLNSQLATAQAKKLEVQNDLDATTENIKRLRQRLADMENQVTAKLDDLQRPLRLPMEHETDKRVVYVIVRYGHIYLCRNSDLSRNETDINWTSSLDSETADPIPGRGIDPTLNPSEFKGFLNDQSSAAIYLVFCVFEDSFPAFICTKQITVDAGFAYGWEPFRRADGPVTFAEQGHTPKPQ